jgi:hypothetical protein
MTELGCPTLRRHHHRAHWEPPSPTGTPMKMSSFSFILYFVVLYKNHLYFNKMYVVCQILSSFKFGMGDMVGKPPPHTKIDIPSPKTVLKSLAPIAI